MAGGLVGIGCLLLACCGVASAKTVSGTLKGRVVDGVDGSAGLSFSVEGAETTVPVLPTEPTSASPGDRVLAEGTMEGGSLVGTVEPLTQATGLEGRSRTVAVVLLKTPEGDPNTVAKIRDRLFTAPDSVNAFYREESYGKISFTGKLSPEGDIFGPYVVTPPSDRCSGEKWRGLGDEATAAAGVSLAGYDHLVYVFPSRGGNCNWLGLADLSGSVSMIREVSTGVLAHELGHNLGLYHASGYRCKGAYGLPVYMSSNCTAPEYADCFDVMGSGTIEGRPRHSNGSFLRLLGFLPPESVRTITESGTYELRSALRPTTDWTTLRIPRARDSSGKVVEWYELEIREKGGVFEDFDDASMSGISIRTVEEKHPEHTISVDMNPVTELCDGRDHPLAPGRYFSDGNVLIETLSAGFGRASARVEFSPPPDRVPPVSPSGLRAAIDYFPTNVELNWDPSSDDQSLGRYLVFRDGTQIGSTIKTTFSDTPSPPRGNHAYTVYAEDEAGNRSPGSAVTFYVDPDETSPSAPRNLRAVAKPTGVELSWDPSTDNVGVDFYSVYRDGAQIGVSYEARYVDFPLPSIGTHTYSVLARDAPWNSSEMSEVVSVTVPDEAAPSPPASPTASLTQGGVEVRWGASTDNVGVTRYSIYRDGAKIGTSSGTALVDLPMPPAGTRRYVVYAEDAAGNKAGSAEATVAIPDKTAPSVPRNVHGAAGSSGVVLGWDASTDDVGVARYSVFRDGVKRGSIGGTAFVDSPIPPVGTHRYVIYAEDAVGNRAGSGEVAVAVPDTTPPTAPSSVEGVVSSAGVELRWEPSTDDVGVSGYAVFRDGVEVGSGPGPSFADRSQLAGMGRSYLVYALDSAGNRSAASRPAALSSAITFAPEFVGPPRPTATGLSRGLVVRLSWSRRGGSVLFRVAASGPADVSRVELWIDGRLAKATFGSSLKATRSIPDGSGVHRVRASAVDANGNRVSKAVRIASPQRRQPS